MLSIFVIFGVAYLVGSFPTSIITGKILRGIDIREHGSGNAGGTNVFRVLGAGPGVFVMLFDVFKGFVATYWVSQIVILQPPAFSRESLMLLAGAAAVIGHIWTIFARFRGGKGVGAAAGMLIALYPTALLICLLIFGLLLATTRIMSIASMAAAVALPIILTIFKFALNVPVANVLYYFSFILAALIVFTHRANIKRLREGTENKFGRKKRTSE